MAVLKVETDIITSIAASPTGWAVKLVIMYVAIFKTGVIVFIGEVKMSLWTNLIFVDKGQFSDPDFISGTHQRENVQFANKCLLFFTPPFVMRY